MVTRSCPSTRSAINAVTSNQVSSDAVNAALLDNRAVPSPDN
jgi:hypothetical protein